MAVTFGGSNARDKNDFAHVRNEPVTNDLCRTFTSSCITFTASAMLSKGTLFISGTGKAAIAFSCSRV